MTYQNMSVWVVTREYAGIAEAGGVKNVSCSLAEGLARFGVKVSVFIPLYGSVVIPSQFLFSSEVFLGSSRVSVSFFKATLHGVSIFFVDAPLYREKEGIYVYTANEAKINPRVEKGTGYADSDMMNYVLQKAVIAFAKTLDEAPDVLHCQDAHTALLPALVKTEKNDSSKTEKVSALFRKTRCFVTIHNAGPGYRQTLKDLEKVAQETGLNKSLLEKGLLHNRIEPFLIAAEYSTLTTVSPWYANELTNPSYDEFSEGLATAFTKRNIPIIGILNGIDYNRYDPTDPSVSLLPYAYNPLIGDLSGKYKNRQFFVKSIKDVQSLSEIQIHGSLKPTDSAIYYTYQGRIASQKGIDVLVKTAQLVLDKIPEAHFIIMGHGNVALEKKLIGLSQEFDGRFLYLAGYERTLARLVVAISDFLVLPSVFEPCGLEDYIAQIFGTIPVAHAVGGLNKIIDKKTGFLYHSIDTISDYQLLANLLCDLAVPLQKQACGISGMTCGKLDFYKNIIVNAAQYVQENASWDRIIQEQYLPLYMGTNKNLSF